MTDTQHTTPTTELASDTTGPATASASSTWERLLDQDSRHDPNPLYEQLRTHPVQQLDSGAFLITGYDEILQLVHDPPHQLRPDGPAPQGRR